MARPCQHDEHGIKDYWRGTGRLPNYEADLDGSIAGVPAITAVRILAMASPDPCQIPS
jgi:hypothetical protein